MPLTRTSTSLRTRRPRFPRSRTRRRCLRCSARSACSAGSAAASCQVDRLEPGRVEDGDSERCSASREEGAVLGEGPAGAEGHVVIGLAVMWGTLRRSRTMRTPLRGRRFSGACPFVPSSSDLNSASCRCGRHGRTAASARRTSAPGRAVPWPPAASRRLARRNDVERCTRVVARRMRGDGTKNKQGRNGGDRHDRALHRFPLLRTAPLLAARPVYGRSGPPPASAMRNRARSDARRAAGATRSAGALRSCACAASCPRRRR